MNTILAIFLATSLMVAPTPVHSATTSIEVVKTSIPIILEKIALCESGNIATAKNPGSSAAGRFQFLWSSWNIYGKELWGEKFYEKNIWSYDDNTDLALYVYKKNGTSDWLASADCWMPLINDG